MSSVGLMVCKSISRKQIFFVINGNTEDRQSFTVDGLVVEASNQYVYKKQ